MAASTLYTLLVKLGFDMASLKTGSKDAQTELAAIGQAAKMAAANGSPAAAALANIAKSAQMVAGSSGATATLRNLAGAADDVLMKTRGSANALNAISDSARRVASATGNGTVLNNYARAVSEIATSTNGSVAALTNFSKGVNRTLIETNGSVAGLNRYMTATVSAAQGAGSAAGAIQAVAVAAKGQATSLAQAAGATAGGATATATLGNAASQASGKVAAVGKAASGTANDINKMSGAAMRGATAIQHVGEEAVKTNARAGFLQRTLSMAFAFGGGVAVTTAIGFIGNALLGFNSRLQQAHIAFTTLLGDSSMADSFIKKMQDFANVTPFDFQGVEESTQRLLAMGFSAEQVLPTLRAVGDAVAGLGGNSEKLDRVTIALGQMMTAGRVNSQDMRQLTEAGIPAWQFLADAIHKTVGETRKMAEDGLIPAAQAIPAILEGMDKKFGGLMAKQARTAQGAFSTIRDAALQTISGAIEPLFNLLTMGLAGLADFFVAGGGKYFVPMIYAIGAAIGAFLIPRTLALIGTMMALKVELLGVTVPLLPLIAAVYALGIAWQENFGGIRSALGPVVKGLFDFAGAVFQAAANSGLLVPILEVLVTLIAVRWVSGLLASAGAMLANAAASLLFSGALTGLTVTADAAAASTGLLGGRLAGLVALLGGPALLAVGLFIAAGVLLMTNLERVGQGVRVVEYAFIGAVKAIIDAASHLPFIGDQFKGLSDGLQESLDEIAAAAAEAEARIQAAQAGAKAPDISHLSTEAEFQKLLNSFKTGTSGVLDESKKLVDQFGTTIQGVVAAAKQAGGKAMEEMAKDIRAHQNAPVDALKSLHDMVRNQLSPMQEIARNIAIMTSEDVAVGLASNDASVVAAANAVVKHAQERLAELGYAGKYAGTAATLGVAEGLSSPAATSALDSSLSNLVDIARRGMQGVLGAFGVSVGPSFTGLGSAVSGIGAMITGSTQLSTVLNGSLEPSAADVTAQMKKLNDEMSATARSQGLSQLNSAFGQIQTAAHRFFDQMHQDNLKLIDDALKHKNALLDAKQALNQAPVTAAQKALDFQRQQIEEWRLRQAVSTASSPEQYRDAVLALNDFLAQKHINEMQEQVDTANSVIDAQKKANEEKAEALRAAEDNRYRIQQEAFDRQLELLRRYLEKHPEEWAKTEGKIMALLASYGISYQTAGATLGKYFVDGLSEQLDLAVAAMRVMADLIPNIIEMATAAGSAAGNVVNTILNGGTIPGSTVTDYSTGGGSSAPKVLDVGSWQIMKDNLLALLHKDEMVVPKDAAELLRTVGSKALRPSSLGGFAPLAMEGGAGGGGNTYVFQVGDDVLAEATDRAFQKQQGIYSARRRVTVKSSR